MATGMPNAAEPELPEGRFGQWIPRSKTPISARARERMRSAAAVTAGGPVLAVEDLRVKFVTSHGTVRAVEGISYEVAPGETVAIVGESGSGKSVSALAVMRLLPPARTQVEASSIKFCGTDLLKLSDDEMREVRGRDIAMIFQEPMTSLNPVLTIGFQIMEPLVIHLKKSDQEARARALELLRLVGITDGERRLDQYPHQLSGGMRQRVMIAIALACDPKLIIADEPTTALDVTIQAQILELMKDLSRRLGISLVIITHNLGVVARYADRVNVMYAARIVEQGTADDIFHTPRHPYTIGLMRSVPRLDLPRSSRLESIEGLPPDLRNPPSGCRFAPRCPYRIDACANEVALVEVSKGHHSACIRAGAIASGALAIEPRKPLASGATRAFASQEPLLAVEGLRKHFKVNVARPGLFGSRTATVKAVDDVSFSIAPGETLGLVGEFGLRQDHGRPRCPEARRSDSRHHQVPQRRHRAPQPPGASRAPAQDPGDLSGPVLLAQPEDDGRPDHRRAAARLWSGGRRCCRAQARRCLARPGRPLPLPRRALPP